MRNALPRELFFAEGWVGGAGEQTRGGGVKKEGSGKVGVSRILDRSCFCAGRTANGGPVKKSINTKKTGSRDNEQRVREYFCRHRGLGE